MTPLLPCVRTGLGTGNPKGIFSGSDGKIVASSSKDSFLEFQTKTLIRLGNLEDNGGFCCPEPLKQRAFVIMILAGFAAVGDFLADFQLFSPFPWGGFMF